MFLLSLYADRQENHRYTRELEAALDLECGLAVEGAGEGVLVFEDELPAEEDRSGVLGGDPPRDPFDLIHEGGPDRMSALGLVSHRSGPLDVEVEPLDRPLPEPLDLVDPFQFLVVDDPHGDEDQVLEVSGEEAKDREEG